MFSVLNKEFKCKFEEIISNVLKKIDHAVDESSTSYLHLYKMYNIIDQKW